MSEQQSSYRQIFKATSLFGGVQVFNILLSILRSKIIAVLLGPYGMGIAGLLTSTTLLVGSLTNFGLGTSAVKNIAEANGTRDQQRINRVVTVFRKLVWITGMFGTLVTLALSRWLSELTFGNHDYTYAFVWLSITLIFNQLTSGQDVLLQGMQKLRHLAKANVAGSFFGLIVSVPLYYFYGIKGIVPSLIATAFCTMVIAWYFARRIHIEKVQVSPKTTYLEGKEMLRMGIMLSLSTMITLGSSYIVRIFIGHTGGMEDVGLYNAGMALISTYVGLVFTAMGTDYYPRLSSIAQDDIKSSELINNQAEIAILVLAPILCIFLVFIKLVVIVLYSQKFLPVIGMVHWAALGMFFKAASWPMGFMFLAKGDSKRFFWNELIANVYLLLLNIAGYKFWGLSGLGISFLTGFILYFLQTFYIVRRKYAITYSKQFYRIFGLELFMGVACFVIIRLAPSLWGYALGSVLIAASILFALREMDKRLNLRGAYDEFKSRNKKISIKEMEGADARPQLVTRKREKADL